MVRCFSIYGMLSSLLLRPGELSAVKRNCSSWQNLTLVVQPLMLVVGVLPAAHVQVHISRPMQSTMRACMQPHYLLSSRKPASQASRPALSLPVLGCLAVCVPAMAA